MPRAACKLAALLVSIAAAHALAAPPAAAQGRDEKYAVTIAPDYLEVQPGAVVQFQAALFHRGDRKFLPQAWEWSCDGGGFADGRETFFAVNAWTAPERPGTYAVKVTQKRGRENGAWGVATIVVPAPQVVVVPRVCRHVLRLNVASVTLHPGESYRFALQACGCHRGEPYQWRCQGGTCEEGFFTAGDRPGSYVLEVFDPCLSIRAACPVVIVAAPPVIARIALDPARIDCAPGGTVEIRPLPFDRNGRPVAAPGLSYYWHVEAGGAVDDDGCFQAPEAPGRYVVCCREQRTGFEARAEVFVRWPCTRVAIEPGQAECGPGERLRLAAAAYDRAGRPLPPCAFEWRTTAAGGAAHVTAEGIFCADGPNGTYRVVARERQSGCEGFADVTVRAACARVAIEPSRFECGPGEVVKLRAIAYDHGARPLPGCEVVWEASGGAIDAAGNFTAGAEPGTYRVVAREKYSACECVAELCIRGAVRIVNIAPRVLVLKGGERHRFLVRAYDGQNRPLETPVTFAAEAGILSADGWFTAPWEPGRHVRVTVTDPRSGASDWADVYVSY